MKENTILKCAKCGNMVELVIAGGGTMHCCGEAMEQLVENHEDAATEKHVPVVKRSGNEVTISVGEVLHPMEEAHSIQWIELIADGQVYRKRLKPGDKPVATFEVDAVNIHAREYCNLHGLWSTN